MSKMNKNKLLTTGSVMVALSAFVPNQNEALANTATFSPTATVVDPITLSAAQELLFGKMAHTGSSGHLTITTAGAQQQTGGVQALGGTYQEGKLAITGPKATNLVLSVVGLAGSPIALTTAGDTLSITRFNFEDPGTAVSAPAGTFNLKVGDATTTFKFAGTGTAAETTNLSFGAQLDVDGDEAAGTYSGSFVMSVTYP
ncbi:MAG: DUF4402 domain-containing protein [Alphaproteobacteria bacterium]|jgi:hypothetical protein|nr:DUF4402 domain-containing protein [Alphaproteobacteria bacterium]MDP7222308.1 DUF4402 domain-containing protein [Alphaproteobacteria bacterium]